MFAEERYRLILKYINEHGTCTVDELAEYVGTSYSTIRRDLITLDEQKMVCKVHGGVTAADITAPTDVSLIERATENATEKDYIGEYAAALIEDDSMVFLDAGTTTGAMIEYITAKNITVVTNAAFHARALAAKGIQTIVLGGNYKSSTDAFVGQMTVDNLKRFNFAAGFFGANGISERGQFSTPDIHEAAIKKEAFERCDKRYMLCDHTKFGKIAPITFAQLCDAEIVCDKQPDVVPSGANVITVR